MVTETAASPARAAYDALAPWYDRFTTGQDYVAWTSALLTLARRHGLSGRRLLDLGCGTGKSFLPLLRDGFAVVGVDGSPAMAHHARARAGARGEIVVADVTDLPALGEFDLVWALCDVANYQLDAGALRRMLAGAAANLAPGGVVLFDCSTRRAFREFFGATFAVGELVWEGEADPAAFADGDLATARLHGLGPHPVAHVQRHHPADAVRAALRAAGLEPVGCYGQTPELRFDDDFDEERHTKAIHVAIPSRPPTTTRR
jgi:SAM-dependent methyltransferase